MVRRETLQRLTYCVWSVTRPRDVYSAYGSSSRQYCLQPFEPQGLWVLGVARVCKEVEDRDTRFLVSLLKPDPDLPTSPLSAVSLVVFLLSLSDAVPQRPGTLRDPSGVDRTEGKMESVYPGSTSPRTSPQDKKDGRGSTPTEGEKKALVLSARVRTRHRERSTHRDPSAAQEGPGGKRVDTLPLPLSRTGCRTPLRTLRSYPSFVTRTTDFTNQV